MKKLILLSCCFAVLLSTTANADSQCGPFLLGTSPANDGFARINGAKPETQKVTFLRTKEDYDNIKMEWTVATDQPGRWVGLEYIKRDGKAILNAQWLQASMNAPRQYATYDCKRVVN
ncbi:hypothetical protein [Atlantibacter hermannii]|uniref:hypothetical protein n=1 Tax=Atlantibacter hermannii TaxID=565 RepID=UPI0013EEF677|nr:hypothetical protein [Atlantibacter hermannii]